ncbi:MAG: hypothetical protein ACAH80_17840 [Alphaproteobacteria bacterium]
MMKKIAIAFVVLLALGAGAFYLYFNGAAKRVIEQAGSEALGVPVKVSGLGISLSDFQAKLGGISVGNPAGFDADKLLKAEDITVTIESANRELVVIREVLVNGMTVSYETGTAGSNLDRLRANTDKGSGSTPGPQVVIQKLKIVNARVIPSVEGLGKTPLPIPDITIRNLGSKENPATASQIATQVMNRIILSTTAAVVKATVKGAVKGTIEGVRDGLGGLKSMIGQ